MEESLGLREHLYSCIEVYSFLSFRERGREREREGEGRIVSLF